MRILVTAHAFPPEVSGVSAVVHNLTKRLAERVELEVATGVTPPDTNSPPLKVRVHRFPLGGSSLSRVVGPRAAIDAYQALALSGQWDLIVMHCAEAWTTDLLLEVSDRLRCPLILVWHGQSSITSPNVHRYYAAALPALRNIRHHIVLSSVAAELPFLRAQLPGSQISIIPNGVDLDEFVPEPLAYAQRHPRLVAVSNHDSVKQHSKFFDVTTRIIGRNIGVEHGVIIGRPRRAMRSPLGSALHLMGGCWYRCRLRSLAQSRVHLVAGASRQDVVSALYSALLMLLTSAQEASPVSILESMAAGTPWLSFPVGCVAEHAGGFVVRDIPDMEAAALALLTDVRLYSDLGQAGRTRAIQRHDWRTIAFDHLAAYQRAVQLTS